MNESLRFRAFVARALAERRRAIGEDDRDLDRTWRETDEDLPRWAALREGDEKRRSEVVAYANTRLGRVVVIDTGTDYIVRVRLGDWRRGRG